MKDTYQSLKDHGARLDPNTNRRMTSIVCFFDPDGLRNVLCETNLLIWPRTYSVTAVAQTNSRICSIDELVP